MALHFIFSGLGVGIGFYLGWKVGMWNLGFINLFSASALWFYSTHFKRIINWCILISLLSALVLLIVALYDILPKSNKNINAIVVFKIICIYAVFAFITTLIREIVKDLEDLEGDQKWGTIPMPLLVERKSEKYIASIKLLTIFGIAWILNSQFKADIYSFLYILFRRNSFLIFCLEIQKRKFSRFYSLSGWIKIIMLSGILSMLVFALLMNV